MNTFKAKNFKCWWCYSATQSLWIVPEFYNVRRVSSIYNQAKLKEIIKADMNKLIKEATKIWKKKSVAPRIPIQVLTGLDVFYGSTILDNPGAVYFVVYSHRVNFILYFEPSFGIMTTSVRFFSPYDYWYFCRLKIWTVVSLVAYRCIWPLVVKFVQ